MFLLALVLYGFFNAGLSALNYVIYNSWLQLNICIIESKNWHEKKKKMHATNVLFSKLGQLDEKTSWEKSNLGLKQIFFPQQQKASKMSLIKRTTFHLLFIF